MPRVEALEVRCLLSRHTGTITSFPDIDDGPISADGSAYGLNDSGQVVGYYKIHRNGESGFLLSGGNFTTLEFPGASDTLANGINDSGQIVGTYYPSNNPFDFHSFGFLLSGGNFTTLEFPGGKDTIAKGINDSGQIVGGYRDPIGGGQHGFLLSGGSYTTLDFPGAGPAGLGELPPSFIANGINDSGQIVGTFSYAKDAYKYFHGFLLSGGSYSTFDFSTQSSNFGVMVTGINNHSQIVGNAYGNSSAVSVESLLLDITPSVPSFATDGALDYGYTIGGADLPQATTVALYWAPDPTFDATVDTVIPGSLHTTETAAGVYPRDGAINVSRMALGDPPAGAKYILVVTDPDHKIAESDEDNNVAWLSLPDLEATSVRFSPFKDGKENGLQFTYTVTPSKNSEGDEVHFPDTQIAFYWAKGPNLIDRIKDVAPIKAPFLIDSDALKAGGKHDTKKISFDDYSEFLKTQPKEATYLLMVIDPREDSDPLGKIVEADHTSQHDGNNVAAAKIIPLVVNVATHGLGNDFSEPSLGPLEKTVLFPGFRDIWKGIAETFDTIPQSVID